MKQKRKEASTSAAFFMELIAAMAGIVFPISIAAQETQSDVLNQGYQSASAIAHTTARHMKPSARAAQLGITDQNPRHTLKQLPANQMKKLIDLVTRIYKKEGAQGVMKNGHHEISFSGTLGKQGSFTEGRIFLGTDNEDAPTVEIDPHGGITAFRTTLSMGGLEHESLDISRPAIQRVIRKELHFWLDTNAAKTGKIARPTAPTTL